MRIKRNDIIAMGRIGGLASIPYVRMTAKSKRIDPKAIRYEGAKQDLAWMIRSLGLGKIDHSSFPVKVNSVIGIKRGDLRRLNGDADNHRKFLLDAMVCSGLLPDDCLRFVIGSDHDRVVLSKTDFVWFCLTSTTKRPGRKK